VCGLRIAVYEVLEYLASEITEAKILEDFRSSEIMPIDRVNDTTWQVTKKEKSNRPILVMNLVV
jgi:uncharacterized protein (DUF433 family)